MHHRYFCVLLYTLRDCALCVLYTSLHWQEEKCSACWQWWQENKSKCLVCYFIVNTAHGCKECSCLESENAGGHLKKKRETLGVGWGGWSMKMFRSVKQLWFNSSVDWEFSVSGNHQATALLLGFSLLGILSNSVRWIQISIIKYFPFYCASCLLTERLMFFSKTEFIYCQIHTLFSLS